MFENWNLIKAWRFPEYIINIKYYPSSISYMLTFFGLKSLNFKLLSVSSYLKIPGENLLEVIFNSKAQAVNLISAS